MRANNKKTASVIGIFSIILKNVFSFFITPLMILVFGKGDYGVYRIVASLAAYFMLLDFGMHKVIVKYTSKYKFHNDIKSQNKYLGIIQVFYIFISIVIALFSIVIYQFIPAMFSQSLSADEIELFQKLFIVLTINSVVTMLFNAYGGVIKSYGRFLFYKSTQLGKIIVRAVAVYIALSLDLNVLTIVIIDLAVNLAAGLVNLYYVLFKIKLRPRIENVVKGEISQMFSYSIFVFLNVVALQLFWSSDNIILGIMTNSVLVTIYSTGTLINSYFQTFAGAFSEFLMPAAVEMVERNASRNEMTNEMIRIGRYIFITLLLIVFVFVFVGDKFIVLWLGEEFRIAYTIALIVMIPQLFTYSQYFGTNIMWAKSKHKPRAVVLLVIALLNCVITIILVNWIGILGAAIGTCFAFVVGYLIFNTWYYHKYVGLDMILFIKELLNKIVIALIPITLFGIGVRYLLPQESWIIFLLQCLILTIFYCLVMYLIGMNRSEKNLINKWILGIRKRIIK